MTTYRISAAARRTGLPTSTLRYYERIGLLPPPARTEAGYRAYEERALDRLAFISRAKGLGLRLDEIGGLADLWDAERCGPVQDRLRELITAKIAETQEHAAALLALSAELATFVSGLGSAAPDLPCGPSCGCGEHVGSGQAAAILLRGAGGAGTRTDVACSLGAEDIAGRLAEWRTLAMSASVRTPIDGGMRLTFDAADLRAIADLVARENACCPFFSFGIGLTPAGTTLEITAPGDARVLIDALT